MATDKPKTSSGKTGRIIRGTRRLAAIMFTDIAGYSKICDKDESLGIAILEEHRQLIRPIIHAHDGREVKTIGDAFMVEFRSAMDAVLCALSIQANLKDRNDHVKQDRQVRLKIGIHLGDIFERANDGDLYGDGVNIAARIQDLAQPEQILFSQQVFDQIRKQIHAPIIDLGYKNLKNIDIPVHIYRVGSGNEKSEIGGIMQAFSSEEELKTAFIEAPKVLIERRSGDDRRNSESRNFGLGNQIPRDIAAALPRSPVVTQPDAQRVPPQGGNKKPQIMTMSPPSNAQDASFFDRIKEDFQENIRPIVLIAVLAVICSVTLNKIINHFNFLSDKASDQAGVVTPTASGISFNLSDFILKRCADSSDLCYQIGNGYLGAQSLDRAVPFLQRACDSRHSLSCSLLADTIYSPRGQKLHNDKQVLFRVVTLYKKACSLGLGSACMAAAVIQKQDQNDPEGAKASIHEACLLHVQEACTTDGNLAPQQSASPNGLSPMGGGVNGKTQEHTR